jgi:hypothetical protein
VSDLPSLWGGEAPERLYDLDEAAGLLSLDILAIPIRSPSRGLWCEQGEALFSAETCEHF